MPDEVVDLSQEPNEEAKTAAELNAVSVSSVPYDPEPEREKVRGRIAYSLTALLAFEMIVVSALAAWGKPPPDLSKLTAALITPIIGVTGIVFGFYYAGKAPTKP